MPSPDMQKFLYTIIKQLDLKSVEWNLIAEATGITNGHAARMRYSRFKKQMEGHVVVHRKKPHGSSKATAARTKVKNLKEEDDKESLKVKLEQSGDLVVASSNNSRLPRSASVESSHKPKRMSSHMSRDSISTSMNNIKNEPSLDTNESHFTLHQDLDVLPSTMASQLPLPEFLPPSSMDRAFGLQTPQTQIMNPSHNISRPDFTDNVMADFEIDQIFADRAYGSNTNNTTVQPMMNFNNYPAAMTVRPPIQRSRFTSSPPGYHSGHVNSPGSNLATETRDNVWGTPYMS